MVREVRPIDALVREIGRDAAYLRLSGRPYGDGWTKRLEDITGWLEKSNFGWERVYDFHPDHFEIEGAPTCIYIGVRPESPAMTKMVRHFCSADGSPRIAGVTLNMLSLSVAIKHSERDSPDFWDRYL